MTWAESHAYTTPPQLRPIMKMSKPPLRGCGDADDGHAADERGHVGGHGAHDAADDAEGRAADEHVPATENVGHAPNDGQGHSTDEGVHEGDPDDVRVGSNVGVDDAENGRGVSKSSDAGHETEADAHHGADEEAAAEVARRQGILFHLKVGARRVDVVNTRPLGLFHVERAMRFATLLHSSGGLCWPWPQL
ncbi:hypothetical protein BN1708_002159 [Verticillium longisporum]|uniref:Uncharacterized protein n=1 Tax=Verticillium longisporum TaxID=100787 RepID=A0A0G4KL52_VERLO|nr:hypothetical protein BN1708_002159 [Verticillium longisporum]